jgi:hypothetical protein
MINKSQLGKYKDVNERATLAERLTSMIDAYYANIDGAHVSEDSPSISKKWENVSNVYYGRKVMSSMKFISGYEPYSVPLLQPRIDLIVSGICDTLTENNPYFIVKGGSEDQVASCVEHDITYALSQAHFDSAIRKISQETAIKGRGPFRVRYETINRTLPGEEYDGLQEDASPDSKIAYSGIRIDPIEAEDFVIYPLHSEQINRASLVGHRTRLQYQFMLDRQKSGVYFDDITITSAPDTTRGDQVTDTVNDTMVAVYDLLYREPDGKGNEKWWRISLAYEGRQILAMEPYELKEPWYFAPYFRGDISTFWPYQSIGDRLLDLQIIYNDAHSMMILGTAASSMPAVGVTGYQGNDTTIQAGINQLITFKGAPTFTTIGGVFNPQGIIWQIGNIERIADGVARTAQMGMGQQLRSDVTATEVQSIAMGQASGMKAYTLAFSLELERMANFVAELLASNFDEFSRFNEGNIQCSSPDMFLETFEIESNGKSGSDLPDVVMKKVQTLLGSLQSIGVQPIPPTKMLSTDAVSQMILDAVDLPTSPSKILIEPKISNESIQPGQVLGQPNGPQMPLSPEMDGQGASIGETGAMPALDNMGQDIVPPRKGGALDVSALIGH